MFLGIEQAACRVGEWLGCGLGLNSPDSQCVTSKLLVGPEKAVVHTGPDVSTRWRQSQ